MSLASMVQYALFLVVVVLLVRPVGIYLLRVFTGQKTMLDRVVRPVERLIYRLAGIDAERQMNGKQYAIAFLLFSLVGTLLLYAILRLQSTLPGAPNRAYLTTPMTPDLAFNTAGSFSTTTTWQAYAGEKTMGYLSQMVGLTAQNFLAGAAGGGVADPFIPGVARHRTDYPRSLWFGLELALCMRRVPLLCFGSAFRIGEEVSLI